MKVCWNGVPIEDCYRYNHCSHKKLILIKSLYLRKTSLVRNRNHKILISSFLYFNLKQAHVVLYSSGGCGSSLESSTGRPVAHAQGCPQKVSSWNIFLSFLNIFSWFRINNPINEVSYDTSLSKCPTRRASFSESILPGKMNEENSTDDQVSMSMSWKPKRKNIKGSQHDSCLIEQSLICGVLISTVCYGFKHKNVGWSVFTLELP